MAPPRRQGRATRFLLLSASSPGLGILVELWAHPGVPKVPPSQGARVRGLGAQELLAGIRRADPRGHKRGYFCTAGCARVTGCARGRRCARVSTLRAWGLPWGTGGQVSGHLGRRRSCRRRSWRGGLAAASCCYPPMSRRPGEPAFRAGRFLLLSGNGAARRRDPPGLLSRLNARGLIRSGWARRGGTRWLLLLAVRSWLP
jgi:hypothetical protein